MTHRKRWKSITTDYTALQSYDNVEDINLCLTQREVAILKALLMPAYWTTRWENLTISADQLNEMVAGIDAKLDTECLPPMPFITDIRQVGCTLEYELDSVWTPFADLSVCGIDTGTNYYTNVEINIAVARLYLEMWIIGDVTSINIFAPTIIWNGGGGGVPTIDRETALCMAAQAYIGGYAARKVQELDAALIQQFVLIAAVTVLTGGIGLLAGMFIDGPALVGGHSYADSRAALLDEDALQAVACCMYDNLRGESVDQVTFQLSLGGCLFAPGSDAEIIREYVVSSFPALESYLSFIDATGRAFVQVSIYDVDVCDCEPGDFVHIFNFLLDDGGWEVMTAESRPYGNYVLGTGWVSEYAGAGQGIPNDERLYIKREGWSSRALTKVELYFESTGVEGGPSRSQNLQIYLGAVQKHVAQFGGFIVPDTWMEMWDGNIPADKLISVSTGDSAADNCEIVCTKIIVWGEGSDPFL